MLAEAPRRSKREYGARRAQQPPIARSRPRSTGLSVRSTRQAVSGASLNAVNLRDSATRFAELRSAGYAALHRAGARFLTRRVAPSSSPRCPARAADARSRQARSMGESSITLEVYLAGRSGSRPGRIKHPRRAPCRAARASSRVTGARGRHARAHAGEVARFRVRSVAVEEEDVDIQPAGARSARRDIPP